MIIESTKEWYLNLVVLITREDINYFAYLMKDDDEYRRHRVWLRLLGLIETWAMLNDE